MLVKYALDVGAVLRVARTYRFFRGLKDIHNNCVVALVIKEQQSEVQGGLYRHRHRHRHSLITVRTHFITHECEKQK